MARIARAVVPDIAYHVTHRGNHREEVFLLPDDYEHYRQRLAEASSRYREAGTATLFLLDNDGNVWRWLSHWGNSGTATSLIVAAWVKIDSTSGFHPVVTNFTPGMDIELKGRLGVSGGKVCLQLWDQWEEPGRSGDSNLISA